MQGVERPDRELQDAAEGVGAPGVAGEHVCVLGSIIERSCSGSAECGPVPHRAGSPVDSGRVTRKVVFPAQWWFEDLGVLSWSALCCGGRGFGAGNGG